MGLGHLCGCRTPQVSPGGQTVDTQGPVVLFRNRQQEVQLFHGGASNDLDVFRAELFL